MYLLMFEIGDYYVASTDGYHHHQHDCEHYRHRNGYGNRYRNNHRVSIDSMSRIFKKKLIVTDRLSL